MRSVPYLPSAVIVLQILLAGTAWSQSAAWKPAGALKELVEKPASCPPAEHLSNGLSPTSFSTATTISFELPADERTSLWIIDATGRVVGTLIDGRLRAGNHHVRFDAAGLPAGIYRYLLRTGMKVESRTFTVAG
ncbi:MAG: Por secretion system C-terminal sorting protein [Chlorobi bacterium]|nr:Por secretion system C-terminal sorting protein [Chlorobiota bacterium]